MLLKRWYKSNRAIRNTRIIGLELEVEHEYENVFFSSYKRTSAQEASSFNLEFEKQKREQEKKKIIK